MSRDQSNNDKSTTEPSEDPLSFMYGNEDGEAPKAASANADKDNLGGMMAGGSLVSGGGESGAGSDDGLSRKSESEVGLLADLDSGDSGEDGDDAPQLVGSTSGPSKAGGLKSFGIIGIVAVIAAGALFTMRQLGLTGDLKMDNLVLDIPEKIDNSQDREDFERLIKDLEQSTQVVQVPLESVQMNPFKWELGEDRSGPSEEELARERAKREAAALVEAREKKIEGALKKLTLDSVMLGSRPAAFISGEFVRPGATISDMFILKEITRDGVILECDGEIYSLAIAQ